MNEALPQKADQPATAPAEHEPNELLKRWLACPEPPLAAEHPHSIITESTVEGWLTHAAQSVARGEHLRMFGDFIRNGTLDAEALRLRYTQELRFLPLADMLTTLEQFATEILDTFSPDDTLLYFPPESASAYLIYNTMIKLRPEYDQFGYVRDGYRELSMGRSGRFNKENISQAHAFVYVDDWILSGEHMRTFLTRDVAHRFHTFHVLVSDSGLRFLQRANGLIEPRFSHRIAAKDKDSAYSEVPVYGPHKIPDRLPGYYASKWIHSIFGPGIVSGSRLVDHSSDLLVPPEKLSIEKNYE
ncbi:hypothetical protein KA078_03050 [Candidatus Woesebacteria bacterium]|nr:hypothetical protein [Candidatus Woesebacteria bacterium]